MADDFHHKRDRALERIAKALEDQNRHLVVGNKNFVDAVRFMMGNWHEMGRYTPEMVSTGTMEENSFALESHKDCTGQICKVAVHDREFHPEDCPKHEKEIRWVVIPITEASGMTLRECGYDVGYESGSFFVKLPILKEEPSAPKE